ncbi:RagB/SusD family nutrient uptake outer membrane protein [Mucilaginibacter sp. RS28]|uniref:RagB/SusD family nutrient uptake outer membrane protein n=1 Tax=Mucilaginibacter straminoryzae TaxID=2932774 RepID=A0A9X1X3Y2_9SPHI|nr:RagB/SusD family nutrient uptake outer membrane protein [Mucilaginibacter straminoryzae]MCJ8209218.1 RagB/SusD family nutrient uptake outer membrane protein [Mucilaginibacter straminoryzae]
MKKQKNHISIFAGLLIALVMLGGCKKDLLDEHPLNQITDDTYWQSADDATMFATRMYTYMPQDNFVYYEGMSDNGISNDPTTRRFGNSTQDPTISGKEWSYAPMRQAFSFFANVDKVPDMDPALKKRLIAEVKFVLAYRYFIMTTLYGDVPLVTSLITDPNAADIPKTPKADIQKQEIQWLDEAAADLPLSYSGSDQGRATKGAALALKARIYLYAADYTNAAAAAKAVMDLGVYKLYANYFNFFQKDGDYSSEDIWSFGYTLSVKQNSLRDILGSQALMNGRNIMDPTSELVNDYESKNGYYPYTKDPGYVATDPYNNRDPRLRQTVLCPGDIYAYPYFPNINQYDPFNNAGDRIGGDLGSRSGYSWCKNVDRYDYVRSGTNNWKAFRYGEVLLNYAEAQNEVSGPGTDVIAALDQIRTRAGMPTVAQTFAVNGLAVNQVNMRNFIRHERRIELAGEGLRYFDVLRWKIGEQVMQGPIYTVDASAGISNISTANGRINKYPKTVIEQRYFNNAKFYQWPIPQSAVDASKGVLTQNPLWK